MEGGGRLKGGRKRERRVVKGKGAKPLHTQWRRKEYTPKEKRCLLSMERREHNPSTCGGRQCIGDKWGKISKPCSCLGPSISQCKYGISERHPSPAHRNIQASKRKGREA